MKRIFFILFAFIGFSSCYKSVGQNEHAEFTTETILQDRGIIWGFAFLPNKDLIFTEKSGKIGILSKGKVTEIKGVPVVANESQGGLLGIALHPDYAKNGWIYTAYLKNEGKAANMNLIRFKIKNNTVSDIQNLQTTSTTNEWKGHCGSRIVFDKAGYLYWSVGEGGKLSRGGADSPNMNAQNVKEAWGKIHRMKDDGTVPADNPILPGNTSPTTVYSYGHRNPQGLFYNPKTDEVWETEHGPKGGDEFNLIKKGNNYGWPLVSYGINYDGVDISGKKHSGYTEPTFQWTPSIGASGLTYINNNKIYKNWEGSYIAGALAMRQLSRMYFENGQAKEEVVLKDVGRVRDVVLGPDGYLYISIEGPGRILKILPKKS